MARLRRFTGKEICSLLEHNGFRNIRQRGSHIVMQKIIEGSTVTVPVPNHREIRIGTLQSIIRQSKLPREVFQST